MAFPGGAVGGFDVFGVAGGVHEGGGGDAGTKGVAHVGELGEVLCEVGGDLDEFFGGGGGELGEVEVFELAPAGAGDGGLAGEADEGDDGDAHVEGVEGGGVAVVGEGVEGDVDLVIELEVFFVLLEGDEGEAIGGDIFGGEELCDAGLCGAFGDEHEEAGVGDGV